MNPAAMSYREEIEYLHAKVEELKAENERLKEMLEQTKLATPALDSIGVVSPGPRTLMENYRLVLEAGFQEERDELKRQRDEYKADAERYRGVIEYLLETVEDPPERNCSCHISPPCTDCVDWSGLREALSNAREAMKGATE